jgi:PKD repeat protein
LRNLTTLYLPLSSVTVHNPPSAEFYAEPTQGLVSLTVTFTNTSQYADAYVWDYGDGITSTVAAVTHTHTYTTAGVYTVSLTAFNPHGSDTYTRTAYIGVYHSPVAGFSATPLTGVAPLEVSFVNTSQDATEYVWYFGDGETSTAVSPTHTYTAGGVYTVSLCALNPGGSAWVTHTNYITVHPAPLASFTSAQRIGVGPLTVTFTNTSQDATTFLWNYGDGTSSTTTAMSHTHIYTMPGVYTVPLTASSIHGAKSVIRSGYVAVFDSGGATIYYVDGESGSDLVGNGTQASPWKTISHALSQMSGTGLELRVASGTYDQDLGESFPITMKSGISVTGVGDHFTVISGIASEPVFILPSTSAFDSSTVLSELKITDGAAGITVEGVGGSGTAPFIRDNWITGNTHGIHIDTRNGSRAYPVISNNQIISNTQHGLYLVSTKGVAIAQPTVQGNMITNNGGAGVYCYASGAGYPYNNDYGLCSPTLINNAIIANTGDGITCHTAYCGGCSPWIEANTIANDGGWGWGRQHDVTYLQSTQPTFVNNFIYGNASGGAIFNNSVDVYGDKDAPIFVNNTIAYNGSYGILHGYPSIVNNIVWGHTSDLNAPVSSVSYSVVSQGIYSGQNHNISLNPQFVNVTQGDYHLLSTSPAIDAGDSFALHLPDFDFDGDPRVLGSAVDIGADETTCNIVGPLGGSITPMPGVTITFPSGAFTDTVRIHYTKQPVTDTGVMGHVDLFYTISATYQASGLPAELQPGQHYTITLSYDPAKVPSGLDEADLALYYWDGSEWVEEPTSVVDTGLNIISATPDHFSVWAALIEGHTVYLPIVCKTSEVAEEINDERLTLTGSPFPVAMSNPVHCRRRQRPSAAG